MKKVLLLLIIAIMLFSLSVGTAADITGEVDSESPQIETSPSSEASPGDSGFLTSGGTLVEYHGTEANVTIPKSITHISAGAFANCPNVTSITVASSTCTADVGAFPSSVTIYAYLYTPIHRTASFAGCPFVDITPQSVVITINYLYPNGATAAPSFKSNIKPGKAYNIASPDIEGHIPPNPTVSGIAEYEDFSIDVKYTRSAETGWRITDNTVQYYFNGKAIKGNTYAVNGVTYSFDEDGNLILDGFIDINGSKFYLEDSTIAKGYRVIGQALYCFADDGVMLRNTSRDSHSFAADGTLIGNGVLVNVGSDSYYLVNNNLCSGYQLIGNSIAYFGTDYRMVKSTTLGSYVFDDNGYITSGIKAEDLQISPLPDLSYTGTPLTPEFAVAFNGLVLTSNVHYMASFSSNTSPGTATLTITGIGPVNGTVNRSFRIINDTVYRLTVRYIDTDGRDIVSEYISVFKSGERYSIKSPVIDGYVADKKIVKGTVFDSDLTITVTYKPIGNALDTVPEDTTTDLSDLTDPFPDTSIDTVDTDTSADTESSYYEETYYDPYPDYRPDDYPNDRTDINEETDDEPSKITKPPSNTVIETEIKIEVTVDTIVSEIVETKVVYNLELLGTVITVATIICGGIIVLIVKWDKIVSATVASVKKIFKKNKND